LNFTTYKEAYAFLGSLGTGQSKSEDTLKSPIDSAIQGSARVKRATDNGSAPEDPFGAGPGAIYDPSSGTTTVPYTGIMSLSRTIQKTFGVYSLYFQFTLKTKMAFLNDGVTVQCLGNQVSSVSCGFAGAGTVAAALGADLQQFVIPSSAFNGANLGVIRGCCREQL
jgi:hypothetical protein